MRLGVIADDFTGGLDAAGFIRKNGVETVLFSGVPSKDELAALGADSAAVIALQIRSCDPEEAVRLASEACDALLLASCRMIYFKYCSTFDSTPKGNIGPVTGVLMKKLSVSSTIVVPSLPVNGRTVKNGILYVNGVPLSESPMRYHPLNPMTESYVPSLLAAQSDFPVYLIDEKTLREGGARAFYDGLTGCAVIDAENDGDIAMIARTFSDIPLATGGSALAGAFAGVFSGKTGKADAEKRRIEGRSIILVGSCSAASNAQCAYYRSLGAPVVNVSVKECLDSLHEYAERLVAEAEKCSGGYPLMITASKSPEERKALDESYPGTDIAALTENFFSLAAKLAIERGFTRLIVGGGETSGAVVRASGLKAFRIGREISPGVSWMYAGGTGFALKSGNFGGEDFFREALYE